MYFPLTNLIHPNFHEAEDRSRLESKLDQTVRNHDKQIYCTEKIWGDGLVGALLIWELAIQENPNNEV